MYDRILIPLDGSDLAIQVLPYVRSIARAFRAEVLLLEAVPSLADLARDYGPGPTPEATPLPRTRAAEMASDDLEVLHQEVRKEAANDLERRAQVLRHAGLEVSVKIGEGDPAEAIAEEAVDAGRTLIAMTTHGRSGFRRWWTGSVTEKIVRLASASVLVVRSAETPAGAADSAALLERIILPVDGSELAEQAIPHAAALAKAVGARVRVMRVVPRTYYVPGQYPVVDALPSSPGSDMSADKYVHGVVDRLRGEGVEGVDGVVLQGDPAEEIIQNAKSLRDSIVVMSTHGRTGIGRWALGSVADKVVHHSYRPVLLVRAGSKAAG